MTFDEYMAKCREHCTDRLAEACFFEENGMQKNALRVETLRDTSPRCGLKIPSQWNESAKRRGWGLWLFSGGTASIFGHCDNNCPRRAEFIQTAPKKAWRNEPRPEPPKGE